MNILKGDLNFEVNMAIYKKIQRANYTELFCVFGFVLIELGLPTLLAIIIDQGVLVNDFEKVKQVGLWMVAICVVGLFALILLAFCVSKITTYIARDMRNDVFLATQKFSHKEYDEFGVSSLVTRTTNDVYQIMQFFTNDVKIRDDDTPHVHIKFYYDCDYQPFIILDHSHSDSLLISRDYINWD